MNDLGLYSVWLIYMRFLHMVLVDSLSPISLPEGCDNQELHSELDCGHSFILYSFPP